MEVAAQRRGHHRTLARHLLADARPFDAAVRRRPCPPRGRLCDRSRRPGEGAAERQWRARRRPQPAGDLGRRAAGRPGQGVLRHAAGLRLRSRQGAGGAQAVEASRRLLAVGAGLDRRSLHGQRAAERRREPEADRHQDDGSGDRPEPVAGRLFPPRAARHADHALLPRLRRPGQLSLPVLRQRQRRQGRHERLQLQEPRGRQAAHHRQRAVRPQGARRSAGAGLQDRQRRRRAGADLLAVLGDGDQQEVQAHRLHRLLVQRSLGDLGRRLALLRGRGRGAAKGTAWTG